MEVIDIVKEWLINNGYDGLVNIDLECGCTVDYLMPCECCEQWNCQAGYARYITEEEKKYFDTDWIVSGVKPDDEYRYPVNRENN